MRPWILRIYCRLNKNFECLTQSSRFLNIGFDCIGFGLMDLKCLLKMLLFGLWSLVFLPECCFLESWFFGFGSRDGELKALKGR